MKILVTGGAGFIGSNIVDAYIAKGHKVVVVDNLLTGFRKNVNPKAKFYKEDIRSMPGLAKIFKKEKPNIVNHLAAIAEVAKSLRDPMPTLQVNVEGIVNVLRAAGENGVKRFLFSSTGGAIYGEPKSIIASEKLPPLPLSPYGLSKQLGEVCVEYYARQYGFNYVIFRYANVFGPRQNPKGEAGVVAIWTGLMRSGGQPIIFGNGKKTRDYVYVKDVVHANVLALTKGTGKTMNIGRGREISDREVFDVLAAETGYREEPVYKPHRQGEVLRIAIDAKHARRHLGWMPKYTFLDGVRDYLQSGTGKRSR